MITRGNNADDVNAIYEIASVIDGYKTTGNVHIKVHLKGTAKVFIKPIKEIYEHSSWLLNFSKEDIAYIGFLYAAEETKNFPLIDAYPTQKQRITKNVVILAMVFITFSIISNITASKVVGLDLASFHLNIPAALVFFPLTYFFDDILTEVYGFKMSRMIIWGGLACNTIFVLCTLLTVYLPASHIWEINSHGFEIAYETVLKAAPKVFFASLISYFCGEFLNSMTLAKLKVLTNGKFFSIRVIGSSAIGVAVDTIIFCNIAFYGTLPSTVIWGIILTMYSIKLGYEIAMLPITYYLSAYLKRADKVNYFDTKTKLNPFSLSLDS